MEATPVVFNNDLLYVGTRPDAAGIHLVVYRQSDAALLSDTLANLQFVSAIVSNGTLYVFGTTNRTQISMTSTTDLVTWTPSTIVFSAPAGRHVFNTSVSPTPSGYVMAYEVCDDGAVCFNARFAQSADLVHWTDTGNQYEVGYYTACPTIRYSGGYYYLIFLSAYPSANGTYYATNVSRSTDLIHWQFSAKTLISPLDGDPAMNASDVDLVEFNGQVRILYSNLSQAGISVPNAGLREATYNGTFDQLMDEVFQ
jgi:alpha-L-fucosidase